METIETNSAPTFAPGLTATTIADKSKAAERMRQWITARVGVAQKVVDRIMSEVPTDSIVRAAALNFLPTGGGVDVALGSSGGNSLHRNALQQMAGRAGIPMAYVDDLATGEGDWRRNLLAHALDEHFQHDSARYLVRAVGSEIRGFMSDRYRRIDCRPVLETLIASAHKAGAIVVDGTASDIRASVKIIVPEVLEPFPGEFVVAGLSWTDSNFGRGANEIEVFVGRLACWNGLVAEKGIRQIHVGRRLDETIEYSEKTLQLDTRAAVSAVGDVARSFLNPQRIVGYLNAIRSANAAQLDGKAAETSLAKRTTTATAKAVTAAFNGADVVQLPPGQTEWRWGQAISLVARDTQDADKKIDLERMAGEVLARHGLKAAA
jgi:O-acetyl-ADP-ribose deacetylase (regulator of RNase III)